MSENPMMFTEAEKQALAVRLRQAARRQRRAGKRQLPRRLIAVCAAAALMAAAAGAASGRLFHTPLYDQAGASLAINGQPLPSEARMVLHADGSATITVSGAEGEAPTVITAPPATAEALLNGETDAGFTVTRLDGMPYALSVEEGRLWLFVNERIPLDVTDRIGAGYTFRYTDENGLQQSATISGTVEDYTVE